MSVVLDCELLFAMRRFRADTNRAMGELCKTHEWMRWDGDHAVIEVSADTPSWFNHGFGEILLDQDDNDEPPPEAA